MDRGNPNTPGPRTRTVYFSQKKPTRKEYATYIIPEQSLPYREIRGVNLKKKIEGGYSQTISSTLDNNLADPISVKLSYIIRGLIKDGGYSIISNTYRGYRPERLASGDLNP
jgi:hypothetical protein